MKKRFYATVTAALTAAALCLTACGSTKETAASTEESTEEESTEAAEMSETAEMAAETTVEESVEPELTFAEENEAEYDGIAARWTMSPRMSECRICSRSNLIAEFAQNVKTKVCDIGRQLRIPRRVSGGSCIR